MGVILREILLQEGKKPQGRGGSPGHGMSLQGSRRGSQGKDPGLIDKSIPKGRLSSAIHHVQEAVGTNELNQLKGAFWLKGSPLPWPQYLPQEGIQFRDFSGGPVVKNLPSSNTEDSIPG